MVLDLLSTLKLLKRTKYLLKTTLERETCQTKPIGVLFLQSNLVQEIVVQF